MPTLNGQKAAAVKKADTTDPFAAIPEGYYKLKLTKVESGKSKAGNAMWTWHFTVSGTKKKLREYTALNDEALWKLATIFEAFGVDPSTNTDTLLGKEILGHIGVEIQTEGKGKGQKRNYIAGYPDQNLEPKVFEVEDEEPTPGAAPKKAPTKTPAKQVDETPDF